MTCTQPSRARHVWIVLQARPDAALQLPPREVMNNTQYSNLNNLFLTASYLRNITHML